MSRGVVYGDHLTSGTVGWQQYILHWLVLLLYTSLMVASAVMQLTLLFFVLLLLLFALVLLLTFSPRSSRWLALFRAPSSFELTPQQLYLWAPRCHYWPFCRELECIDTDELQSFHVYQQRCDYSSSKQAGCCGGKTLSWDLEEPQVVGLEELRDSGDTSKVGCMDVLAEPRVGCRLYSGVCGDRTANIESKRCVYLGCKLRDGSRIVQLCEAVWLSSLTSQLFAHAQVPLRITLYFAA